jgi:hypothetical protein
MGNVSVQYSVDNLDTFVYICDEYKINNKWHDETHLIEKETER